MSQILNIPPDSSVMNIHEQVVIIDIHRQLETLHQLIMSHQVEEESSRQILHTLTVLFSDLQEKKNYNFGENNHYCRGGLI